MPNFYSPQELKIKFQSRNFQLEMIDWVEKVLRPLENDAIYLMVAQDRPSTTKDFTTFGIQTGFNLLEPYIILGTPAHELGHHILDALGGSALISNDPLIAKGYRNEIDAAFWSASAHDGATGIQHRYIDNEWELNHGEIFAWIFYHLMTGVISEPVRRLAAYAIAAHPHVLKEMTAKNDGVRHPWNDNLFFYGNRPVRIAVWITRWTDRLENGADAGCHLPRHALASVDGARVGGHDLHQTNWYSFSNSLVCMFKPTLGITEFPVVKNGVAIMDNDQPKVEKVPSMLQHLQGYANSALARPYSAYNQHDARSRNMRLLMDWKIDHSRQFIDTVLNTTGTPDFELFVNLMKMKSGFPNTQMTLDTIEMVRDLWNQFSKEDRSHWAYGFEIATVHYFEWLSLLQNQISKATDPIVIAFQPLVPILVTRVKKT